MPTIQISVAQVNFTNYIHVTVAKVATPGTVIYEQWIPTPFAQHLFVLPVPDFDVYYINFYDAPTNVALGTLQSQVEVSALTSEYAYEVIFYTIGSLPATATLDVTQKILTDTYLIGGTVQEVVKENFRPLEPATEYTFDNTTGAIAIVYGATLENGEKLVVVRKYATGVTGSSSSGGLYTGTLNVTAPTYTLLGTDKNKRIRCVGTAATQVITLTDSAGLAIEDGWYFDNSVGGMAVQVKLFTGAVGDRIKYNGFDLPLNEFQEFWVSRGEHLLIRKSAAASFEIISDYVGVRCGERMSGIYKGQSAWLPEDNRLLDGDQYGRLWYYIKNILPSTQVITDATVSAPGYVHPAGKEGMFVVAASGKAFRMPNTQGLYEQGLKDFNTYGGDTYDPTTNINGRLVDQPGGKKNAQLGTGILTIPYKAVRLATAGSASNGVLTPGLPSGSAVTIFPPDVNISNTVNVGKENNVVNNGVIFMTHI